MGDGLGRGPLPWMYRGDHSMSGQLGSQRRIAELEHNFAEAHERVHQLLDSLQKDRDELAALLKNANEVRDIALNSAKAMAHAADAEKADRILFRRFWPRQRSPYCERS